MLVRTRPEKRKVAGSNPALATVGISAKSRPKIFGRDLLAPVVSKALAPA
ncbi:hypothetical protein BX257_4616 [Streptomyces sp. 3212.3]|nr:hypothetical protein BX257_4616 [Streptomyces sp. 3212.3]